MVKNIEEQINRTTREKFLEAVNGDTWAETDGLVDKLDTMPGFWENVATLEEISRAWKRSFVSVGGNR